MTDDELLNNFEECAIAHGAEVRHPIATRAALDAARRDLHDRLKYLRSLETSANLSLMAGLSTLGRRR